MLRMALGRVGASACAAAIVRFIKWISWSHKVVKWFGVTEGTEFE